MTQLAGCLCKIYFFKSAAGYALCKFRLIAERAGANWVRFPAQSVLGVQPLHSHLSKHERKCKVSLNVLLTVRRNKLEHAHKSIECERQQKAGSCRGHFHNSSVRCSSNQIWCVWSVCLGWCERCHSNSGVKQTSLWCERKEEQVKNSLIVDL